jgi:hypothetical protein
LTAFCHESPGADLVRCAKIQRCRVSFKTALEARQAVHIKKAAHPVDERPKSGRE